VNSNKQLIQKFINLHCTLKVMKTTTFSSQNPLIGLLFIVTAGT